MQKQNVLPKQKVLQKLKKLESEQNVKVIYAVLTGSRSYGINSIDSDHDIKFVFVRKHEDYFRFDRLPDTIHTGSSAENDLELTGFDVSKLLRALLTANPSVIEWFYSPVFMGEAAFYSVAKKLISTQYDRRRAFLHYLNFKPKNDAHRLRNSLCKRWVVNYSTPPPVDINGLWSCFDQATETGLLNESRAYIALVNTQTRAENSQLVPTEELKAHLLWERMITGNESAQAKALVGGTQTPEELALITQQTEDFLFKTCVD